MVRLSLAIGAWVFPLFLGVVAADDMAEALQHQASSCFEKALQAVRESGDKRAQAETLDQAIKDLDRAATIYQTARQEGDAAACRLLAARAARLGGNGQRAVGLFVEAERLARQSNVRVVQARALLGQAFCALVDTKELVVADAKATEALRIASALNDAPLLFEAMCQMSEVDVARGKLPSAWDWIKEAFKLVSQVKDEAVLFYGYCDRHDICFKLSDRANTKTELEFAEQNAQQAVVDADAALAIANKHGWKLLAQQCQQLAKTARQRLELVRMQRNFNTVTDKLQQLRAFNPQQPRDVVVTRKFITDEGVVSASFLDAVKQFKSQAFSEAERAYLEAGLASISGKPDEARTSYVKAVELLEGEYRNLADYGARKAKIAPAIGYHYYYWPMLYLLDQGDTAKAFSLMEASRSRLLMDLMATGQHIELADPSKQRLYEDLRRMRAEISDLRDRLERSLHLLDAKATTDRLLAEIASLEAQHRELLERVRRESPELLEVVTAGTVSLDEIQDWTKRDQFDLLEYVVFGDQIVAWHIGPSGVQVRAIFLPRVQLLDKIGALNRTLVDSNVRFDTTLARQFYLFLIEPLKEFITTERLVVIPHDELYDLSFQALQNPADERYLGERYQISYAPSARLLKQMGQVASLDGASALAVAAPGVLKSEAEAQAVARLLPKGSQPVMPDVATKTLVKRLCAGYDVLHLSAHGQFDRHEPMLSFVQLAPQSGDDGKLTAGEMAALPLSNTRLVTLSACESGRASEAMLGEMLGIPRALIFAGAKAVLLTRWKVDPDATQAWMTRFYTHAGSTSLPEAARRASADLRSQPQFAHPYYWAPFELVGR